MSQEIPFDPYPLISDPHKQTIISSLFNLIIEPASIQRFVTLSDGDKISLEITTPQNWKPTNLTVVLVHGLCGSHRSPNLVRMAKRLEPLGIRTVRFNMRGCGSGKGHAKRIYHGGRSDDVFECIKVLKKETPDSPIVLIGFSLGGNLVLKLAGELSSILHPFVEKVIAVSPPVELYSSVQMIGDQANEMYEKYFYRLLRDDVHDLHSRFKELPRVNLPKNLKIYEFDQLYLAPMCNFSNAIEYYHRCSASHVVGDISVSCKILFAEDDPIVSSKTLDQYHLPSNVKVFKTKKGGHMGYLGKSEGNDGFYWLDNLLMNWILETES